MVIKLFRRHSMLICAGFLAAAVAVTMLVNSLFTTKPEETGTPSQTAESTSPSSAQQTLHTEEPQEMRAVWVPYMSLDMSREEDKSEAAFQKKFDAIVSGAKECGMKALIVHVRPFADALYPSELYPWSHAVGGTQGVDPGYDPLKLMVNSAHQAGLAIHAWINPLRIQVNETPSILAQESLWNVWKADAGKENWVFESGGGKYLNPGVPGVRQFVAQGVREIVANYEVDGIQFDDYFYPAGDEAYDKAMYEEYCTAAEKYGTPLSQLEWRQANINALLAQVYEAVKAEKAAVVFGVAPQGNIQNDLSIGADVRAWCRARGYVDYICPQLYVNFENPVLPYDDAVQTWKAMVTEESIQLYFGLGVYKAGSDADNGTWKNSSDILARQVSLGRETGCDGFMFYSWPYLDHDQTREEVANVIKLLQ